VERDLASWLNEDAAQLGEEAFPPYQRRSADVGGETCRVDSQALRGGNLQARGRYMRWRNRRRRETSFAARGSRLSRVD
jgi:hypothetical protein